MTSIVPPILRTAVVNRPVDEAFAVFTEDIGAWWPLPTHSVFGDRAGGVHFVDGRLVERSVDGAESTWAEVLEWAPPHRLTLAWHPGSDSGPAGRVDVRFTAEGPGATRVDLRHDGWEAFGEDGLRRRRGYAGPSAWGHVLDHFADGAEPHWDAIDLTDLEAAYDAFFAEARSGIAADDLGRPVDGGWTAEQVLAHVALNDVAMTAVAHGLAHGARPEFENRTSQDRRNLDAVVAACGGRRELVAHGRRCATQAIAAIRRLDADQRTAEVPCRFEHDGEVVKEGPMTWDRVAVELQASQHLPAHVDQLRDLRA